MADWLHERPELADALLAAVLFVVGIAGVRRWPVLNESGAWFIRDLLVAGMSAPLVQRRRAPRAVLAIVCVAAVGTWIGGFFGAPTVVASGLAFYGLGRYVERPASLRAFFPAAVFVAMAAAAVSLPGDGNPWFSFLGRSGVVVAGFAFGDSQRSRSALLASLRLQADRADALRVAEAQRAVVEERGRLVRELHDVVAHSISVMVVQAVAAERLAVRQPAAAAESIRNVADIGRRALTEMRHIFDVFGQSHNLGESKTEFAPQPTLDDLDAIVAQCRNAGMIIDVVGEASNGAEALDVCRAVRPDVVVMDIRMPTMDGVEATRRLLAEHSGHSVHSAHGEPFDESLRVLMLTTFDVDELVHAAIRAGASGFILKDAPPEDLFRAVRVIAAGDAMIAPSVTRRMLAHFAEQRSASTSLEAQRAIEHLTDRERDVLKLIARGLSNREIGDAIFVAETTVKTHVGRIFMKLNARDRMQAAVTAYDAGFVVPGS